MADADFDGFDLYGHEGTRQPGPGRSARVQAWINGAGALTSFALIAGLCYWGYNLAVRDVRGVPVIEALEGPARVAPDDPGGEFAVHQGMAVNEIAADGTAAATADRLTLAPKVAGLAPEDQPMGELGAALEDGAEPVAPDFDHATPVPPAPPGESDPMLAGVHANEPLPDGPTDTILEGALAEGEGGVPGPGPDAISTDIPGVSQSVRPPLRPGERIARATPDSAVDAMAEAAAAAVAAALAPQELDAAPGALSVGTRLVQIGAFPSESDARLQWDKTAQRFGALMDGKRRVIEQAASGGSVFYRLRVAGFDDLDDAQRFCAALKADGAECVPAVVR